MGRFSATSAITAISAELVALRVELVNSYNHGGDANCTWNPPTDKMKQQKYNEVNSQ